MKVRERGGEAEGYLGSMPMRDWVDERVKVEGGKVRVFRLDVDHRGSVVPGQVHMIGQRIIKIGKGYAILGTNWLADDNLVDVIEFIPVFISNELLVLH